MDVKRFLLNDWMDINVSPGEDFYLSATFDSDQSAITPTIIFEEYRYPYSSNVYKLLDPLTISTGFVLSDNEQISNGTIELKITKEISANWTNRRFKVKMLMYDGTNTWCAFLRTMSILDKV